MFNNDPLALALLRAKAARSPGLRFGGKRWSGQHSEATRERMCASQRLRRAKEMEEKFRAGERLPSFTRRRFALWFWLEHDQ